MPQQHNVTLTITVSRATFEGRLILGVCNGRGSCFTSFQA